MLHRHRLLSVVCLCIAVMVSACGQQPATISSVALPQGWQTVREDTLVFALPPTWEVVSAADGNFEDTLDELAQTNPQLEAVATQGMEALASGKISIMAFDLDPERVTPDFTTNLSVGQVQLERLASLDEVGTANEQQLAASGFKNVQRDAIRIGTRDAIRLRSTLKMQPTSEVALDLALEQYIVVEGQQQFVLTFTTTSAEQPRLQPTFQQIIGTLQVQL